MRRCSQRRILTSLRNSATVWVRRCLTSLARCGSSQTDRRRWFGLRSAGERHFSRRARRTGFSPSSPRMAQSIRSVALQCVSRMYEAEPPSSVPLAVADRAYRFAERFLDPDVFTPGEPSVIARNALSALAAVGDQRLGNALAVVRALGRPWLARRVKDELNRIYRGWIDRGFSPEQPAVANLGHALASFV